MPIKPFYDCCANCRIIHNPGAVASAGHASKLDRHTGFAQGGLHLRRLVNGHDVIRIAVNEKTGRGIRRYVCKRRRGRRPAILQRVRGHLRPEWYAKQKRWRKIGQKVAGGRSRHQTLYPCADLVDGTFVSGIAIAGQQPQQAHQMAAG